ncbi:MAG TPA: TSUP family transporter, partial [Candidatus Limnocylindrales bacterium]|nr:TSUP family transporter [Candidatus Limnocylindrales bacterium]
RFILGAVPVNVLFTVLLPRVDLAVLGLGLGLAVIAAGVYLAARRAAPTLAEDRLRPWAPAAGAASGILGGLYGMGGPVGVLFFARAEGDPTRFRALITSIFAVTGTIRLAVLALEGSYTPERLGWAVASLPAIALGLAVGYRVHDRVTPVRFRLALGVIVTLAGLVGLVRALTG